MKEKRTRKTYMVFNNKCEMCGCIEGVLHFRWFESVNREEQKLAQMQGRTITFFECSDCGFITAFEQAPIIAAIIPPQTRSEE